jgi:hypothetical protein
MNYPIQTYFCDTPSCGTFRADQAEFEDGRVYCPYCGNDEGVTDKGLREAEWATVAAYETDRVYGGPEEGGWYYTAGEPMRGTAREFHACDFPAAKQYEEHLRMRYADHRDVMVRVTPEQVARVFPRHRPSYR